MMLQEVREMASIITTSPEGDMSVFNRLHDNPKGQKGHTMEVYSGRRNATIATRPKSSWDIWVNWTCSPMRTGICVVLAVDVSLSQWERDRRIKLRLSGATLHFTDRWAASQPPPRGDKLTYLAWMWVSVCAGVYLFISVHHWLCAWCSSIFPSLLYGDMHKFV